MISAYLHEIAGSLADKTVKDRTLHLRRLEQFMAEGQRTKFDRQLVVDFLRNLKALEVGPASIALHKSSISALYSWLVDNEKIQRNPVRDLSMGSYRSNTKPDECAFTEEEYGKIKEACRQQKIRFGFWEG